ncbi:hypothetical protein LXL04_014612 [Taraxacum kok-saghyz]
MVEGGGGFISMRHPARSAISSIIGDTLLDLQFLPSSDVPKVNGVHRYRTRRGTEPAEPEEEGIAIFLNPLPANPRASQQVPEQRPNCPQPFVSSGAVTETKLPPDPLLHNLATKKQDPD